MAKVLQGTIVSVKMNKTVVVEVTRKVPHPLYKKLMKRSKKFLADSGDTAYVVGAAVRLLKQNQWQKINILKFLKENKYDTTQKHVKSCG